MKLLGEETGTSLPTEEKIGKRNNIKTTMMKIEKKKETRRYTSLRWGEGAKPVKRAIEKK